MQEHLDDIRQGIAGVLNSVPDDRLLRKNDHPNRSYSSRARRCISTSHIKGGATITEGEEGKPSAN